MTNANVQKNTGWRKNGILVNHWNVRILGDWNIGFKIDE
jgi:hypothetical protein